MTAHPFSKKASADLAPRRPDEKFSIDLTVLTSRGTEVPPDVRNIIFKCFLCAMKLSIYINVLNFYGHSTLSSPELILAIIDFTGCPSTVAPRDCADPRTCLTVPVKVLASDFSSITLATFLIYSSVRFPLCLTFLTFFRSLS